MEFFGIDPKEKYIETENGILTRGFTSGSCCAGAAKAAAERLLSGIEKETVELLTPKGIWLNLKIYSKTIEKETAIYGIRKESGDDPDITNGLVFYAKVKLIDSDQSILRGGQGIGIVTKRGLEVPVGYYAINKTPKQMIIRELENLRQKYQYTGGFHVWLFVPEGEEIAKKTFNPRLGIVGGISILGTSGIVEPMSERALLDSIYVELKMKVHENTNYIIGAPGNYGLDFLEKTYQMDKNQVVKYSNYLGEFLDQCEKLKVKKLLLISHIGKMIKAAGGIMNTHSKNADARLEILGANAILAGADREVVVKILSAVTTEEGIQILKRTPYFEETMKRIIDKILFYIYRRISEDMEIGVVIFVNDHEIVGQTDNINKFIT